MRAHAPLLVTMPDQHSCSAAATAKEQAALSRTMERLLNAAATKAGGASAGVHVAIVSPTPPIRIDAAADWGALKHFTAAAHSKFAAGAAPLIAAAAGWDAPPAANPASKSGQAGDAASPARGAETVGVADVRLEVRAGAGAKAKARSAGSEPRKNWPWRGSGASAQPVVW